MLDQQAGDKRTDKKAQPKRDANQCKRARPLTRRRVIRDIRLRNRQISRGRPVNNPRDIDHPQRVRPRHQHKAQKRPDLAYQQQRLAPKPIRQRPQQRPRDQLTRRKHRDQHRGLKGRGVQALGVDGEQRDHQGHAKDIDQHD